MPYLLIHSPTGKSVEHAAAGESHDRTPKVFDTPEAALAEVAYSPDYKAVPA